MGLNMTTTVACAIEINYDDLFENYEKIPDYRWCEHRENFEPSDAKFCPECGRTRPTVQTFSRVITSAFPERTLQEMREKVAPADFEEECYGVQDLEHEIRGVNGLSFMTNYGEGMKGRTRLFLGKHLTSIDKWTDGVCLQWSPQTVAKLAAPIEEKAKEIGFEGEAKLILFTRWT